MLHANLECLVARLHCEPPPQFCSASVMCLNLYLNLHLNIDT